MNEPSSIDASFRARPARLMRTIPGAVSPRRTAGDQRVRPPSPGTRGELRRLLRALVVMEDVRPDPDETSTCRPGRRAGEATRRVPHRPRDRPGWYGRRVRGRAGVARRRVAIKVLRPGSSISTSAPALPAEARAAARLHHTNIVPVFGVGEDGGTFYYVMQYIEGRPLDQVLVELRRMRGPRGLRHSPSAENRRRPDGEDVPPRLSASRPRQRWPCPCGVAGWDRGVPDGPGRPRMPSGRPRVLGPPRPAWRRVPPLGRVARGRPPDSTRRTWPTSASRWPRPWSTPPPGCLHRDVKPSNLLLDVWGHLVDRFRPRQGDRDGGPHGQG